MAVGVERDRHSAVPESLANDPWVNAGLQRQRSVRVTEVVPRILGSPSCLTLAWNIQARVSGCSGVPSSRVNNRSCSERPSPRARRSSA